MRHHMHLQILLEHLLATNIAAIPSIKTRKPTVTGMPLLHMRFQILVASQAFSTDQALKLRLEIRIVAVDVLLEPRFLLELFAAMRTYKVNGAFLVDGFYVVHQEVFEDESFAAVEAFEPFLAVDVGVLSQFGR